MAVDTRATIVMQGSGYSRKRMTANGLVSAVCLSRYGSSMAERRIVDPEDVGSSPIRSATFVSGNLSAMPILQFWSMQIDL